MHINTSALADASKLAQNQTTAAPKSASAASSSPASPAVSPAATDDLQPTPEQLFASIQNITSPDEADQITGILGGSILSSSSLASSAQANLNPDTVFQLLLE